MSDIRDFAAATPFQFPELRDASRLLVAFKFSAQEVIPTLGILGNIAAATSQPIGELAELIGRFRVQNQIYSEDLNQLTGRGINVLDGLAERMGVSISEVKRLASESKIEFDDVFAVLTDLANVDYAGMLVEQSETLNGQWSTLKDNIGQIQQELGTMMLPTLKELSTFSLDFVRRMGIVGELMSEAFEPGTGNGLSQTANQHIANMEEDLRLQEEFMKMQMADPQAAIKRSQEHMARIDAERAVEAEKERLRIAEEQAKLAAQPMADADVDKVVREHEKFLADMHKQQDKYMRDLTRSISDAERNLQRERDRRLQQQRDVSAGPGAGMEVNSAEAARFQAQQINAAIGAATLAQPTAAEQEMIDILEKLLEEAEKNGFSRIR
jgi:tape measure domain-containing protein